MTNDTKKYEQQITNVCERAFENGNDLGSALQACEGLFPTVAVSKFFAFDRHRTQRWIDQARAEVRAQSHRSNKYGSSFILSTWDFCEEACEAISAQALSTGPRTCLLGVPSIVPYLSTGKAAAPHVLIDLRIRSTESNENVVYMERDINTLNGQEFSKAFQFCFLDPPWYLKNFLKWIDLAGEYCREGGTVAFALLGRLTRPKAVSDREEILQHCRARGLTVQIHKDLVLYDVPSFEGHMLWRAGIPPVRWKRADLVIAKRDEWVTSVAKMPPLEPLPPFGQVKILGVSIDVVFDRYETATNDLILEPPGGYWMETPSRRALGVLESNVFTSNGAKLISPRPVDLFSALSRLESSHKLISKRNVERLGFPTEVFDDLSDAQQSVI